MSLLMDALKKAELAKRQGQEAADDAPGQEATLGLTLEPIPDASPADPAAAANLSPEALASHLEDLDYQFLAEAREAAAARLKAPPSPAAMSEPPAGPPTGGGRPPRKTVSTDAPRSQGGKTTPQDQSAAQNLFAAKQIDKAPNRKTFALVIGVVTVLSICAIGGYFWWELQPKSSLIASRPPTSAPPIPAPAGVTPAPTVAAATPAPTIAAPPAASIIGSPVASANRVVDDKDDEDAAPVKPSPPTPPRRARAVPAAEPEPESPVRVTKAPLKVNPALLRGYEAFNRGDLDQAQLEYERAQKADPRNTDAMHGLAAIAVRQGRHEQADLLYRRIIEADPQDTVAMSALINNRSQIDPGIAESRLKSLSAAQPELAAPQFALGNLYARNGRWNEAQQAYFRAYGAEQDNPDILYNLAISLEHLRQNKLAAQYYSLAIAAAGSRPAGFDPAQAAVRLQSLQR